MNVFSHSIAKASANLFTFLLAVAAIATDNVGPGSAAPSIQIKRWIKGTPVARFEAGKIYVVEFWATWCGPCIQSIPHVTELAKKNKDVTFIGVGIWERDEEGKIDKFVKDMGEKMSYNVAYSGDKDGMAMSWMNASGQTGIPSAFIVKDGKIMWIGHPMHMDKPLAEIKAGTFDLAAFKQTFDKEAEAGRKYIEANKEFDAAIKLYESGKREEGKQAVAKVVERHPNFAAPAERMRYFWLAEEDPAAWEAKTKKMLESGKPEDMQTVASFALIQAQKPESAAKARSAIAMVLKANTKNDMTLYMYARSVYLKLNDNKEALEVTDKMLELLPTSPMKDNKELKDNLLKSKAELEAKLKGG